MKQLRIEAYTGSPNNRRQKEITFNVPDEVASYFMNVINANNASNDTDGATAVSVEGSPSVKVKIQVLASELKY